MNKKYFNIVRQSSTVGHTELTRIVSYYRFLNTDPGAAFIRSIGRTRRGELG
jgi:hypothetical protein